MFLSFLAAGTVSIQLLYNRLVMFHSNHVALSEAAK